VGGLHHVQPSRAKSGYDELGIEQVDENAARVEHHRRRVREAVRVMPRKHGIAFA
jgi:hypothetical protein